MSKVNNKKMSHTKGEWKVGNKSTTPPIIITVVTEITGEGGEKFKLDICDVMPKVDKSREANAKLIAQAPSMLKELKEFRDLFTINLGDEKLNKLRDSILHEMPELKLIIDRTKAAIKATE